MKAQILLATHNPPPGLFERQIASLVAQTETDWQCLVFDDRSSDRSRIVAELTDTRFRLLATRDHLGPYRAFEHLLRSAGDTPVFLCDQDDYWHPDKLRRLLAVDGTAFSAMRVVDSTGHLLRERFLPAPSALSPAGLLLMNCVSGASMKVSPAVRQAALPFPAPGLRGWHDQWLAAVAARMDELTYLDDPLVDYTQHSAQVVGDGLRQLTRARIRRFAQRPQLRSRTGWVQAAASRLLTLPGGPDADLQAIAAGRFREVVARHQVPLQRTLLLYAGRSLR